MSHRGNLVRACLFGAALSFTAGFAGKALASDPLAGDAIGLPPDINIALYYNQFEATGVFAPAHGSNISNHTKLDNDVNVFRYVRTFDLAGTTGGAQVVFPIVSFLSGTEVGGGHLTTNSGFAQPLLGVFDYPINDNDIGRSAVVAAWIFPPFSSANKNYDANPSENLTTYEFDAGFHQFLLGDPKGANLALEAWDGVYFYSNNTSWALPGTPYGATYREQPTDEVRVYFPFDVIPATGLTVAPGFFQSFGGKQTYKVPSLNDAIVDSGNRTNISELRLSASMFLTPTVQVMGIGEYDVAGHGGFLTRSIQFRIFKIF